MAFEQTENYHDYIAYKRLKNELHCTYKGIDLMKVLAIDLIEVLVCREQKSFKKIAIALFRRLLSIATLCDAFQRRKAVFTFDSPERNDHWALINAVSKEVDNATVITLQYHYIFWFNAWLWLKYFFVLARKLKTSPKNKLFIAARCLFYHRIINNLYKNFREQDYTGKLYVPFLSSAYTESCLTLFFKAKNVKTFHVFHGIGGRYQQKIPNDIVCVDNVIVDKVLALSEAQKKDMVRDFGVNENLIEVAGHPKYPFKTIAVKNSFQRCVVLGGIVFYDKELEALLLLLDSLAEKHHIHFELKPHPRSKIQQTKTFQNCKHITLVDKQVTLNQLFQAGRYDFAVTHNTSSYYECMYYNLLPLRWGQGENMNFEGLDDKFFDKLSFSALVARYKKTPLQELNQKVSDLLAYAYGMGINRYKELIA
jgi:hypothetical protein